MLPSVVSIVSPVTGTGAGCVTLALGRPLFKLTPNVTKFILTRCILSYSYVDRIFWSSD